jgi:hypothetical protein
MPDPYCWMTNAGGAGTQVPMRFTPPVASVPTAPLAAQIATANVAVTVFAAGTIVNIADIINPPTATEPLYVDLVGPALAGAATSVPLLPGQAYRVSAPISTPVTAVAASAGHAFVAVSY